jgi:RNA:NAD 2'-phosphotransferase (TPT1/KptA family)
MGTHTAATPVAATRFPQRDAPQSNDTMIVYHGTTADCRAGIIAEGLRPGSYVAPNKALSQDYAYDRAITLGADACVVFELDVPDPMVTEVEAWWWTGKQLILPLGCPPSCIVSVDDSDPRPYQAVDNEPA